MVSNIGSEETVGGHTGENQVSSESQCTEITLLLKLNVLGELLRNNLMSSTLNKKMST